VATRAAAERLARRACRLALRSSARSSAPAARPAENGGFVLLAQPERSPRAVVALDANGDELGRALVDDSQHDGPRIDWTQYRPPSGTPRIGSR